MLGEGRKCWGRGELNFSTASRDSRSHREGSVRRVQGDDLEANL